MTSTKITPIKAELLDKKGLALRLGLSTRTIENKVMQKAFPAGVRIGKFVFWTESVVHKWTARKFEVQDVGADRKLTHLEGVC